MILRIIFILLCSSVRFAEASPVKATTAQKSSIEAQMNFNKNDPDSLPEITETPIAVEALPQRLRTIASNQKEVTWLWSEIRCGSKVIYRQFEEISGESKKYNSKGELLWTAQHCYNPKSYNRTMKKLVDATSRKPDIVVVDSSKKYKYIGYTLISGSLPREGEKDSMSVNYFDADGNIIPPPNVTLANIIFSDISNFD